MATLLVRLLDDVRLASFPPEVRVAGPTAEGRGPSAVGVRLAASPVGDHVEREPRDGGRRSWSR